MLAHVVVIASKDAMSRPTLKDALHLWHAPPGGHHKS